MLPRTLETYRQWVNKAYLDFIQLQPVVYTDVVGCTCPGLYGVPRRVVVDGNSLAFTAVSAVLTKPWIVPDGEPQVALIPREQRHPVPQLQAVHRKLLRTLVHKGSVSYTGTQLDDATAAVEISAPGFTVILQHIAPSMAASESDIQGSPEASTGFISMGGSGPAGGI